MTLTHRFPLAVTAMAAVLAMSGTAYAGHIDGRSADTLDAAYTAHQAWTPSDGRSPDTLDAASAPRPVVFTMPRGFDWNDAGIGAGLASAVLVLVAGVGALWLRHHPRSAIRTT